MPKFSDSEILEIARDCRIRYIAEIREETYEDVSYLADKDNLCGHCALVSLRLFQAFKDKGLRPVYCVAEDHVYVRVGRKNYDLTAMQFSRFPADENNIRRNFPSVYVFVGKPWGPILFKTTSTQKLQEWLKNEDWPHEQIFGLNQVS